MTFRNLMAAAVLAVSATGAQALTLTLDGGWQGFDFDSVGSAWSEDFDFSIGSTAYLAVTDAFLSGDQFSFTVNGDPIGVTSVPTSQGDQILSDFSGAFADPRWSSGEIELSAGTYTIVGSTILSPFGGGRAAIQLSSRSLGGPVIEPPPPVVPLPAGGLLLISALGGAALLRRKRPA